MSMAERLAIKHPIAGRNQLWVNFGDIREARWWMNAIADEMDNLVGDDAANLYDAYENDEIPKWLRNQAKEDSS